MIQFGRRHHQSQRRSASHGGNQLVHPDLNQQAQTLLDVPVGHYARVQGLSSGMPQLQAYGLTPGYWVRVLQHSPVTVIQIDHLELALESELAGQVLIEEISSDR